MPKGALQEEIMHYMTKCLTMVVLQATRQKGNMTRLIFEHFSLNNRNGCHSMEFLKHLPRFCECLQLLYLCVYNIPIYQLADTLWSCSHGRNMAINRPTAI